MATKETDRLFREQLESMRKEGVLTDVTLRCGDGKKEFIAHKVILSGSSKYFRDMFSSDEEKASKLLELSSVGEEEMKIILPFMYTGQFRDIEDNSLLTKVFEASVFLQISALFEWGYKKLVTQIGASGFRDIFNLYQTCGDEGMLPYVSAYFAEHFVEICQSEEFLKLNEVEIEKLTKLLHPVAPSVDTILTSLLRWAEVDDVNRKEEETLLKIIPNLDLQLISSDLLPTLLRHRYVTKNHHLLVLLTAEATSRTLNSPKYFQNPNEPKFLMFGDNHPIQPLFTVYDVVHNTWLPPIASPIKQWIGRSLALVDNNICIFGGFDATADIIKFCPKSGKVSFFGKLEIPVQNPGVEVLNDTIYIVNTGDPREIFGSKVQRYNLLTKTCETVADTRNAYRNPQTFVFSGCLYVLGTSKVENTVERYDPKNNTWKKITSIPGDYLWCKAVKCAEKLYVLPVVGAKEYHLFDFSTDTWVTVGFPGCPHHVLSLKSANIKGKWILFVFDADDLLTLFDIESGCWITKSRPAFLFPDSTALII